MTDDKTRQLENRIDKLESTIEKMMPSRRDALKMGGAALVGGAAMSGTASAGTNQVGTIGSQASPVDLESEDINNADTVTTDTLDSTTQNNSGTVTTQDLVVNGTTTGISGGVPADFTYNDVSSQRSVNTEFTNNTGSALYVSCIIEQATQSNVYGASVDVDNIKIQEHRIRPENGGILEFTRNTFTFFVPNGSTYEITGFSLQVKVWFEAQM